ncbi:MAG: hypothetical protein HY286_05660 [Planctomycetes bacterium]|nr:hypothetical protein [Planctomycetota bacterium]
MSAQRVIACTNAGVARADAHFSGDSGQVRTGAPYLYNFYGDDGCFYAFLIETRAGLDEYK